MMNIRVYATAFALIFGLFAAPTAGADPGGVVETYSNNYDMPGTQTVAPSSSSAPTAGQPPLTPEEVRAVVQKCQASQKKAASACSDPNSAEGMSAADKAMLLMGLSQLAQMGAQIAAQRGSAAACTIAAGAAGTLQTLTLLKAGACSKSRKACIGPTGECTTANNALLESRAWAEQTSEVPSSQALLTAAVQGLKDIGTSSAACQGYESNQMLMAIQMQQLMGSASQMASCASQSRNAQLAMATPAPVGLSTAQGDCSNPTFAATSSYCICKANPSDPSCAMGSAGLTPGQGSLATGGVTSPGINGAEDDSMNVVDTTPVQPVKNDKGMAAGNGGAGGGGGFGAGGTGGLNPEGGGGEGASGINKDVITGQAGAGGGGLGGGGLYGGGGGGGPKPASVGGGGSDFNLSKYLPKNMFKNRGLAGMTVPAQDGVTGPLGPTIWEKVHTRYEDKKSSLILDK